MWEANLAFMRGGRSAAWGGVDADGRSSMVLADTEHVNEAMATMLGSGSDRERTSAGYHLGWVCHANEVMDTRELALNALTDALTGGSEAVQRAAMYGLSVGGPVAAEHLGLLISELLAGAGARVSVALQIGHSNIS